MPHFILTEILFTDVNIVFPGEQHHKVIDDKEITII
jgi:hypothetical protein